MKIHRIYGVVLRYYFLFIHSFDRLTDAFYWPVIDLLLWGLTSAYFISLSPEASRIIRVVLSGVLLWLIVWRGQYEVAVNLLEDLWNRNFINIFSSPLKFSEWISSFIIIGLVKAIISFVFASIVAFFLYHFGITLYGFYLLPFFLLLIMTGWWVGFMVGSIVLKYGTRVQTLAWTTIALLSPFSGVFYPISILPQWAQNISAILPTSYVFEGARQIIDTGIIDPAKLYISFGLNLVYIAISLFLLHRSFKSIFNKGLVKLF